MKLILTALTLLASLSSFASAGPCGLSGSVETRIKNCSTHKNGFSLVAKTKEGIEVYQDVRTSLLWGHRLPSLMNQVDAKRACDALKDIAGFSGVKWKLPSYADYRDANYNGIREALPNNKSYLFWSSTVTQFDAGMAVMFNGYTGGLYDHDRDQKIAVRCVAQK